MLDEGEQRSLALGHSIKLPLFVFLSLALYGHTHTHTEAHVQFRVGLRCVAANVFHLILLGKPSPGQWCKQQQQHLLPHRNMFSHKHLSSRTNMQHGKKSVELFDVIEYQIQHKVPSLD